MMSRSIALLIIILCGIIFGYLSGSILWSVIIGKHFFNKDPRDYNSKNAGATNSTRLFGKKVGFVILVLDILKCFIPTLTIWLIAKFAIANSLFVNNHYSDFSWIYLTGLSALVGHCYPLYFKFKGGKAASSMGALLLSISIWLALIALIIWILIICIKKYVSLASILSSIICTFLVFIPGVNWLYMLNIQYNNLLIINGNNCISCFIVCMICLCSSIILIIRHWSNIKRLLHHNESTIEQLKTKA